MNDAMTLSGVLPWLTDATLVGNGAVGVQRVHTDTRTLQAGDLFVALRGERSRRTPELTDRAYSVCSLRSWPRAY